MILVVLYTIFEFYLIYLFMFDFKDLQIPENLPKFIFNILSDIKNRSQVTGQFKTIILQMYLRAIFALSLIVLIYYLIFFLVITFLIKG